MSEEFSPPKAILALKFVHISFYSICADVLSTSKMPWAKLLLILFFMTEIEAPSIALMPALRLLAMDWFFSILVKFSFPAHRMPLSLFFYMVLNFMVESHLIKFLAIVTMPLSRFCLMLFIMIKGSADRTSIPVLHLKMSQPFILALLPLWTLIPVPSTLSIFVLRIYYLASFPWT